MKKSKILSVLVAFCTMFTLSFTSLAKNKPNLRNVIKKEEQTSRDLKGVLKKEYNIDYMNSVDLQKDLEEGILKTVSTKEDKELAKLGFRFALCLGQLYKNDTFGLNQKREFKNFVTKNFVEKKVDFVNYDKAVFEKMKAYFENAYKRTDLLLTNIVKPEKVVGEKSKKELEDFINGEFKTLLLQFESVKNKNVLERLKKDFKNKKSELYKKFIKDLEKGLKYIRDNFKMSLKTLEKFKNEKSFRKKVSTNIKNFNLKEFFNGLDSSTEFVERSKNVVREK